MNASAVIHQLWAKTDERSRDPSRYHPLLFHLIDAGNVASAFVYADGKVRIVDTLRSALGSPDQELFDTVIPAVVALHDIGKALSLFQGLVPEQRARLECLGFQFPRRRAPAGLRHQHMSAVSVPEILAELRCEAGALSVVLADAYAGHHGAFQTHGGSLSPRKYREHLELESWLDAEGLLITEVAQIFPVTISAPWPDVPNLRFATAMLAGFIIICDWLASDQDRFQPAPGVSLEAYLPRSRDQSKLAVKSSGLVNRSPSRSWAGFQTHFPRITQPRPLQRAVDEIPDEQLISPGLIVIEAPTGEGKTEAALALSQRVAALTGSEELFIALPTMATSNQMYRRVLRFLNENVGHGTGAKLVHGQAFLVEHDFAVPARGDRADPESPAASASSWFAPRKRALLAPYGVGTVDQVELCVLNARHYVLRLLGLAGKVVVIDEVHAYDTYMNTILDHALWWLASAGTTVILLSATLSSNRKRELVTAYRLGLDGQDNRPESPREAHEQVVHPYPFVTIDSRDDHTTLSPDAYQPDRSLQVHLRPDPGPRSEAERLLTLTRNGGAVCWITNTVDRSQQIYRELRQLAPNTVERHLIHARMPGDQRLAIEERISARFGARTTRQPTDSIIVVGTQVLEQSLDLDFDRMITDLAPIDLLLQRAGRLHRHAHDRPVRPAAFAVPVLEVVVGNLDDGLPDPGKSSFVYGDWILWRTWLVLEHRRTSAGDVRVSLPGDFRELVEATYERDLNVSHLRPEAQRKLEGARHAMEQERARMLETARVRLIPDPVQEVSIMDAPRTVFEEDDDGAGFGWGIASTRYGEPSISIVPLVRRAGRILVTEDGPEIPAEEPDRETQLRLLRRSLRISWRDLVENVPKRTEPALAWWTESPLLRNYYPLVFQDDEAVISRTQVRIDPELGLVYSRLNGAEEK